MMRSLYSGVAGLKTHQTKMDVIGNNIANVNTTSFKSQSITFSDLMYQTTQTASGATETRGGVNARQIGLGAKSGAINTAIEGQGATQTTNNPFDIMITGKSFFVVNSGAEQLYTRDGSFYVDGAGNLAMQSNGYFVMGWVAQEDRETGEITINKGELSQLQIMSAANSTYSPASTTAALFSGNIDDNDSNVKSDDGKTITLEFYDNKGYLYTGKFVLKDTGTDHLFSLSLTDIIDSKGNSLGEEMLKNVTFGSTEETITTKRYTKVGNYEFEPNATGDLISINAPSGDTKYAGVPNSTTTKNLLSDIMSTSSKKYAGVLNNVYGVDKADEAQYGSNAYYTINTEGTAETNANYGDITITYSVKDVDSVAYATDVMTFGARGKVNYFVNEDTLEAYKVPASSETCDNLTADYLSTVFGITDSKYFSSDYRYYYSKGDSTTRPSLTIKKEIPMSGTTDITNYYNATTDKYADLKTYYEDFVDETDKTLKMALDDWLSVADKGHDESHIFFEYNESSKVVKIYTQELESTTKQYTEALDSTIQSARDALLSTFTNKGYDINAVTSTQLGQVITDLTNAKSSAETQKTANNQSISDANDAISADNTKKTKLTTLKDAINALKTAQSATTPDATAIADARTAYSDALTAIQTDYNDIYTELSTNADPATVDLTDTTTWTAVNTQITAIDTAVTALNNDITAKNDIITAANSSNTVLDAEIASATTQITAATAMKEQFDDRVTALKALDEYDTSTSAKLTEPTFSINKAVTGSNGMIITYPAEDYGEKTLWDDTYSLKTEVVGKLATTLEIPDSQPAYIFNTKVNGATNPYYKAYALNSLKGTFTSDDNPYLKLLNEGYVYGTDSTVQKTIKSLEQDTPYTIEFTKDGKVSISHYFEDDPISMSSEYGLIKNSDGSVDFTTKRVYNDVASEGSIADLKETSKSDTAGLLKKIYGITDEEADAFGADGTYKLDSSGTLSLVLGERSIQLKFKPENGALELADGDSTGKVTMKFNQEKEGFEAFGFQASSANPDEADKAGDVYFDFSTITNYNTNGSSTIKANKGDIQSLNTGRAVGEMNGVSISTDGQIYATYSNGQTKLLGQIATAEFANASGLSKEGDNLYSQTLNSGEATIQAIDTDGGYMNTGVLEMSNVDLSSQFTEMITTQRGFQANSRIITVSDTLLEELTNLKR